MTGFLRTAAGAVLVLVAAGCEPIAVCPQTVDEALQFDLGDAAVGGGYVIRFIPADDPEMRGYEINLTRPIPESTRFETYFLRTDSQLLGIVPGQPVLLIGERTDRSLVVVAGRCPPLTPTTEEDVTAGR